MKMLAHVFRQVQKFQQSAYAFADVPQLQKILSTDLFVMRQDRELYKYSNSCEPPQKSYAARMTLNMSDLPYLQQAIGAEPPSPRDGPLREKSPSTPSITSSASSSFSSSTTGGGVGGSGNLLRSDSRNRIVRSDSVSRIGSVAASSSFTLGGSGGISQEK